MHVQTNMGGAGQTAGVDRLRRWCRPARRLKHGFRTMVRAALGATGIFVVSAVVPGCSSDSREQGVPSESQRSAGSPSEVSPTSSVNAEKADVVSPPRPSPERGSEPVYRHRRQRMVDDQLRGRDITDARVLDMMARVPRHEFVPNDLRDSAYSDSPLPIGHGQTISQPYIVALMTQLAQPKPDARSLDVGTGSGYQAAVLAGLVRKVHSIEIVPALADGARRRLKRLGLDNVEVRCGDGYRGWPEHAPFDVIIVAAAPDHVPQPLVDQLAPGGRLVIPVGQPFQSLLVVEKTADGRVIQQTVAPVSFVPMTGEAQRD